MFWFCQTVISHSNCGDQLRLPRPNSCPPRYFLVSAHLQPPCRPLPKRLAPTNQQTSSEEDAACAAHFQLQNLRVLIHISMICSSSGSAMLLCGRRGTAPSALAPRLAGCSAVLRPCPSRPQRCSSQMPGSQIRGQAGSEGSGLWLPPSRPSRTSVQAQAVTGEAKIKASSRPCQRAPTSKLS